MAEETPKKEMFKITRAWKEGQGHSHKQRTSRHFAYEPRIGDHVLRRSIPHLMFSEDEMKSHEAQLKRLLKDEVIKIERVALDGSVSSIQPPAPEAVKPEEPVTKEVPVQVPPEAIPTEVTKKVDVVVPPEAVPEQPKAEEAKTEVAEPPAPAEEEHHESHKKNRKHR